jgi:phosphomevalonate kinase
VAHLSSAQSPNPFVETTLTYVLSYVSSVAPPVIKPAAITILADYDYYSQPVPDATNLPPERGQRFIDFKVSLSEAHKTGLGSSAALVTALTAGLLLHYLPEGDFSLENENDKMILHNLAQTAHCAAQGKVGSGFDVASAVYGSSLYRRFSPSLLTDHGNPGSPGFAESIRSLVRDRQWDTEILKAAVKVPPGIRLVMCDVDCGSQTPGMVKQVLAWRNREPEEAGMIWSELHRRNEALAAELTRLADVRTHDYGKLEKCIIDIRVLVREMSRLSGVPIEPEQQTQLLDACTAIDGVVGGVVPGAGGYDAIALLIEDKDDVLSRLRHLLAGWEVAKGVEGSTSPSIGKVKLLEVREEMEGIRTEDASMYGSWAE